MFLPLVQFPRDVRLHGFFQDPLFAEQVGCGIEADLHGRWEGHGVLGQSVVKKRLAALDAVGHFAAVTEDGQEAFCERAFSPYVQRCVQRVPYEIDAVAREAVEGVSGGEARVACAEFGGRPGAEEGVVKREVLTEAEERGVVDLTAHCSCGGGLVGMG